MAKAYIFALLYTTIYGAYIFHVKYSNVYYEFVFNDTIILKLFE